MSFSALMTCAKESRRSSKSATRPSRGHSRVPRIVAPALRSKRSIFLLAAAAAVLTLLAAAVPAFAGDAIWRPLPGESPNQDKIRTLYSITFIMGMVIMAIVEALIIYAVIKFRAKR